VRSGYLVELATYLFGFRQRLYSTHYSATSSPDTSLVGKVGILGFDDYTKRGGVHDSGGCSSGQ
jgi:hypothetical protein